MEEVSYDNSDFEWNSDDNAKYQSEGKDEYQEQAKASINQQRFKRYEPPKEEECRVIYTDGGSRILEIDGKKRYIGAWAFYDKDSDTLEGKAEDGSTNNQMELISCIRAIEHLNELGVPKDQQIMIKLDSEYVKNGIVFWVKKWVKNNWCRVNAKGQIEEVKNLDLWKRLYELNMERKIHWEHVSGHSGIEGNEKVDIKCGALMDEFMKNEGLFK